MRRGHEVIALSKSNPAAAHGIARTELIDGTETDRITSLCLETWPDVIVNCAALSNPATVEAHPQLAEKINVALPRHLAQISTHLGARFLHISTDMVFDGHSAEPYRSTDMPCPTNLYGQTKLMAEREVLEHNTEDPVVLRIPILMGRSPGGQRSVHEKLIQAIGAGQRPKLFCDEMRQPTQPATSPKFCSSSANAAICMASSTGPARKPSAASKWDRILQHFGLPLDSIESVCKHDDPEFANRPSNLTFNWIQSSAS